MTDAKVDHPSQNDSEPLPPYAALADLNFEVITMGMKWLPFFEDDLYLGMQAMNVGYADAVITNMEYELLRKLHETERTPVDLALTVGALSQMWVYGLYEVLRMWRDRRYHFDKWLKAGGIDKKVVSLPDDDPQHVTNEIRRRQLTRYKNDADYRARVEDAWQRLEEPYRFTELFRMNLAKHCAPGKNNVIPREPGYGRINHWCGALQYELVQKDSSYVTQNRRDIADLLRTTLGPVFIHSGRP